MHQSSMVCRPVAGLFAAAAAVRSKRHFLGLGVIDASYLGWSRCEMPDNRIHPDRWSQVTQSSLAMLHWCAFLGHKLQTVTHKFSHLCDKPFALVRVRNLRALAPVR